jgi:transcription antitermination factor NusB
MSMKPTRHQAREIALQILYRYDIGLQPASAAVSASDAAAAAGQHAISAKTPTQLIEELNHHFDHFKVPVDLRGFAAELVAGTIREMSSLDALLEKHASNWKLGRMSFIDRNLMRMSIYELKHFPDTPVSVVIDEAVELAKEFGTAESPGFVNGVLDAIKGAVRA